MNSDQLRYLLEEVFSEEKYFISFSEYKKYNEEFTRFNIKVYSEKMCKHMTMITIENYIIGTTICKDVWQMNWSLPNQNYYMRIAGDPKIFLMLTKERIDDILILNKLNNNLMLNIKEMDCNPITAIRNFKLNKLDII
jgi:hypothetical protein